MNTEKTKVLVVDDEPKIVEIVASMLTQHGFDVRSAHDGEAALRSIREACPDVVLLDIMMPKMDGTETAEAIKQNPNTAKLPVVFLTSLVAGDELMTEGDEIGGHLFLAKPFTLIDLVSVIDRAITREANKA